MRALAAPSWRVSDGVTFTDAKVLTYDASVPRFCRVFPDHLITLDLTKAFAHCHPLKEFFAAQGAPSKARRTPMSHAATFDLSEELADLFTKEVSCDGTLACILVSILDEAFTLGATVPLGASAEADFEATKRLLSEDEATYLLFRRLRGGESQGWAFISFVRLSSRRCSTLTPRTR